MSIEQTSYNLNPENEFSPQDFELMMAKMITIGEMLESSNPSTEVIFQGSGDTGTIQTSADINSSDQLLGLAREKFPASFSEEDDPKDEKGYLRRRVALTRQGLWMIDSLDGTGDRRYGVSGSPERRGFSNLASYIKNNEVVGSIVVRPAYKQELIFKDGNVQVSERGITRKITSRPDSPKDVVRVNVRKAYPTVNFPPDFWEFVRDQTGINFQEVRSGGAGDSLSRLVLGGEGGVDLVVARKGDWKAWDTGPFDPMLRQLGGKLTDCDNNPLGDYDRDDLWHHRGVIASIGDPYAHDTLVSIMQYYQQVRGTDLVIQTPAAA